MRFPNGYHPLEALGEDPVIGLHQLYVPRLRRDVTQRTVVIRDLAHELRVADQPDSRIVLCVFRRYRPGSVGTLVVHQQVFEPRMGLGQNTLDTLAKKISGVVKRSYNADQWSIGHR